MAIGTIISSGALGELKIIYVLSADDDDNFKGKVLIDDSGNPLDAE